ncbi:Cof-type HAD-IIB family hydrolase [Listeria ilorinensis]|uniref:Cof-type HAD-IIB family hydrolase n=1 Tax=Listeria ilorinensis TaxID=2867439 RepID=UPI001EF4575E|nr:Cof-type HAD-IIB family hydrolase [Listeria ilorinensis]
MEKKLIVLDLDGTTLKDDQTISKRTAQTLQKARDHGHEVMIATGRPYRLSALYYKELALSTPIVNFNGAVFHHPLNVDFTDSYHHSIDLAIVRELLDFTLDFPLSNIAAEIQDSVFLKESNDSVPETFRSGVRQIFIGDLKNNIQADPTSLLFFGQKKELERISMHLDHSLSEVISYHTWGASWPAVEVVKHGIHKAVGVKAAANALGFDRKDIIAFGDETNDLEMLDYAGVGVAMGNAVAEAKNVANSITASNEEDGIALYLEENLSL